MARLTKEQQIEREAKIAAEVSRLLQNRKSMDYYRKNKDILKAERKSYIQKYQERQKELSLKLKKVFILGSLECGLTDDEIKEFVSGFKNARDVSELNHYFTTLCNMDSDGFVNGIISYQIQIEDYTQAVEKIKSGNSNLLGNFYNILIKLSKFCKKNKINIVEILN